MTRAEQFAASFAHGTTRCPARRARRFGCASWTASAARSARSMDSANRL